MRESSNMGKARQPAQDTRLVMRVAREHIKRAEREGKALDHRIGEKRAGDPGYQLDSDEAEQFRQISTVIVQAGAQLTRAAEHSMKVHEELSGDELDARWRAELIRLAPTLTDEDWAVLDAARGKR